MIDEWTIGFAMLGSENLRTVDVGAVVHSLAIRVAVVSANRMRLVLALLSILAAHNRSLVG